MESHPCPKCAHDMDEGWVDPGSGGIPDYDSHKQIGLFRQATQPSQECGQ
jgi:hypothetical protein